MKNRWIVVVIYFISLQCLTSQSKTIQIAPHFHLSNNEYITEEIHFSPASERFEFIGLSCYHFDKHDGDIFYRLKSDNHWSSWLKFEIQHEYVEMSRSAYRTKPIQESFSDIQFKSNKKLDNKLGIRFFFAAEKENTFLTMNKSINCDKPEVCERNCWCPTCPIDNSPEITVPTHLIVHHSAGNNQSNNFSTVVEYIWDLHVNTNGWDDIGYNWLIDPNGIVYEGRPDDYQGAHFSCINENTVGVCIIGDYTLEQPSEAALNSLVSLLAFEAIEHNIDITEEAYHETGEFFLEGIAGHRDSSGSNNACSATACPGNSFYPLLEDVRLQVSELPCYNDIVSSAIEDRVEDIVVFPNPTDEYLFLESMSQSNQILELVDAKGASVGFIVAGEVNNLSHLKAGLYFLIREGEILETIVKN